MFGMDFWSNQDPDDTKRETPDHTAFLPDAAGKVDMTGYSYRERPDHTNFDYGFWVAEAENYDPSRATKPNLTSPRFMGPGGKPDPTIERVFRGKATLQAGSPAGAVKMLQQALLDLKKYDLGDFGPAKDGVDGKYGDKTSSAVKQFKIDENLGAQTQGSAGRGVILRLDDLFPP